MANTYFEMLQAVENYYGSGSDQWVTMANWTGYQSTEVANILKQTPGVDVYLNEAGELVSYSVSGSASSMTAAEATAASVANTINSNALTEVAVQEAVTIPANVTAGATAGTVEITSGATKLAAGGGRAATVLGHVGTAVVGAAVGMKLGVWIDGALYNANPEFWDSHNLKEMNPETWGATKVTNWLYDYSGYDDFVCHFDKDGQMYVDENVLAMYAQYMANQGAFEKTGSAITPEVQSELQHPNFNYPDPIYYTGPYLADYDYRDYLQELTGHGQDIKAYFLKDLTGSNYSLHMTSTQPFTATLTTNGGSASQHTAIPVTYGDTTFYNLGMSIGATDPLPGMPVIVMPQGTSSGDFSADDINYILLFGDPVGGGIEGINQYAQTPEGITPGMTIPDIINLLKQQYPDLWNSGIKQGTLNDDGTITDRVYVPVAMPTGGTDKQPTTDPDYPGAVDPSNEPQTEKAKKVIEKTPEPTPPGKEPDTGTGNTPPVVPPTGSADALYKIYNPTNAQIQSFGAWLWSSNFVDQLLKVFNDPMQAIISLHKIYATPHTGGTQNIKVGYLDSGVASKWVDEQYITVDCGTVSLNEIRASILDYDPFTDVRLYLPFIGIVKLDTADVMRGRINVKYNVDVITGTVVAMVSVTRDGTAGGVVYQYTGNMAEVYPLSSGSYMGIITGVLGIAAGIAGTIATGGAAAPALLGGAAGLTAMHTRVEHSNGFSGNAGAMACKKPYLIISRQQTAMSNNLGHMTGWPSNEYVKLSQCSGLTVVKNIHLTGISGATDSELDEIENLLKEGVLI